MMARLSILAAALHPARAYDVAHGADAVAVDEPKQQAKRLETKESQPHPDGRRGNPL